MRIAVSILALMAFHSGALAASIALSGKVTDGAGVPLENAVVQFRVGSGLLAHTRTLSDALGKFQLRSTNAPALPSTAILPQTASLRPAPWSFFLAQTGEVTIVACDARGKVRATLTLSAARGILRLQQPAALLHGLDQGIYMLYARAGAQPQWLGNLYHPGGTVSGRPSLAMQGGTALALRTAAGENAYVVVRKTGYLPDTLEISAYSADLGTIALRRDPLEDRIDSVLALMNTAGKIAQMTQPLSQRGYYSSSYTGNGYAYALYGSTLDGGDQVNTSILSSMVAGLATWSYGPKIPVTYGKDAVHGHAGMAGATIFPHNIGLGATRDSALVRRIGEATAKEMWATGTDLNFAPAVSVPQDERWGRTYEGFGETPELAVQMGAAMVRGLQGERYDAPWRVTATAKHFIGDGATTGGVDRGNSVLSDSALRATHLPGYEAAVEQGVLSVMASFSQVNGTHQHIDSLRLTGLLKTELGFDGYVISDWDGIGNSNAPGATGDYSNVSAVKATKESVRKAINAGVDMAMEASAPANFISLLTELVADGSVSAARLDDAVRRILRAKFRAGRMDNFAGPAAYRSATPTWLGHAEHRALGREAVRKSLVVLKNEGDLLPLDKTAKIYVTGSHADNSGYQCGGWTLGWQGYTVNISAATSILTGMHLVSGQTSFASSAAEADVIVLVTGEKPYAEWKGDSADLTLSSTYALYSANLATWRAAGKKIVTVLVSGRPLVVGDLIEDSDAFVAAWLPGSEGAGVADVLFGDYAPSGKLPHTWPASMAQIPINKGDGKTGLYPYGYGLTW